VLSHIATVIVVGLAAGYLVRAWQTGSLFSSVISDLETDILVDIANEKLRAPKLAPFASKLQDLLLCPLCLSPYVAAALWLLCVCVPKLGTAISVVFASAQIAFLCRTYEPKHQ
jgi:hypothetical protein